MSEKLSNVKENTNVRETSPEDLAGARRNGQQLLNIINFDYEIADEADVGEAAWDQFQTGREGPSESTRDSRGTVTLMPTGMLEDVDAVERAA